MLGQVNPTPFDLRFWILDIPVRVHPLFWLMSIVMGSNMPNFHFIMLWVVCVFVSILIHELGHAVVARKFGYDPEIVLHGFGGYAMYLPTHWCGTTRSILISLAGPGAGFLFYGVVHFLAPFLLQYRWAQNMSFLATLHFLERINLWWGLINLLPVLPLDGGRVCLDLFNHFRRDGEIWTRRISMIVAFTVSAFLFQTGEPYAGILFVMLGVQNLQALNLWGGY